MLQGPSQYLEVYLPSPTTVSFTVTTRRPESSKLRANVRHFLRHTCRIVLVYLAVLANAVKARDVFLLLDSDARRYHLDAILKLCLGSSWIRSLTERSEWWILTPLSLLVVYLCLRRDYVEESLLVLQGLGIQTSTTSRYFFMAPTTTFIPTTQIQDIVIHEAFKGLAVRFYLAVIVEGATEVVVVFPTLLPRREILEEVWRGGRKCLYSGIR
ncbi:hypothetical protein PV08_11340 [Exophiala spinifera]|uniref:Phosphatidylinositol N-acetylglucosaminyltransferase subunit H conserved domain-containing protein n=1 Tax=Exophiala spinifera TaxID=91928 RepID=A0A0D2AUH2_9EURO|nr:uncharacterized protein PV08_11340 [Exophiala spinifera]KIW10378.1 hypothetical protein PV08_11340 [Exophiala spinifera]